MNPTNEAVERLAYPIPAKLEALQKYFEICELCAGRRSFCADKLLANFNDDGSLKGEGKWRAKEIYEYVRKMADAEKRAAERLDAIDWKLPAEESPAELRSLAAPIASASEGRTVGGRPCEIDVTTRGHYVCTQKRDDEPDKEDDEWMYLQKDGQWHVEIGGDNGYWSSRAELDAFLASHASPPAEGSIRDDRCDKPFHKAECKCAECLAWIEANPLPAQPAPPAVPGSELARLAANFNEDVFCYLDQERVTVNLTKARHVADHITEFALKRFGNWHPASTAREAEQPKGIASMEAWLGGWPHRPPPPAALFYHAFEQGMHAGWLGFNHKKDCPYANNDYRMWWKHGCIVGEHRRTGQDSIHFAGG